MIKCPRCNGKGEYMREIGGYRPCEYCNGTGKLAEQKQTNFDQVTASPEVLAEFIADHSRKLIFDSIRHREPDYEFTNEFGNDATKPDAVLTWLKQEIEE